MGKVIVLFLALLPLTLWAQAPVSETGLPLPRFVSLKSDEANMRNGPGKRYPVKWSYRREGLPMLITHEYNHWRKVSDPEGIVGWMHRSVLSGRRTAVLLTNDILLRDKPNEAADIEAKLMKGVIVGVESCQRHWCKVEVKDYSGWIPSELIWGGLPP